MSADPTAAPVVELDLTNPAVGGEVVGREASGRVVFVTGGLPGERVRVAITEERRDFARGTVLDVLAASPDRVAPPCPAVHRGCGGCDLQHLAPAAQPDLKAAVVIDALRRLGRVPEPVVRVRPPLPDRGFRATVRAAVVGGRAGFRRRQSHEVVPVEGSCPVAHPALDELLAGGRFGAAAEVTLRVGTDGQRLAVLTPGVRGDVRLPEDVTVVGADELRAGAPAAVHVEVAGTRLRVSANSFFQSRLDGAEALVAEVRRAAGAWATGPARVVDAYCGVGLFAATVGVGDGRTVVAVERGRSSAADARHNLGRAARVVRTDVERWNPAPADLVVADPSRRGLGADAVTRLAGTRASRLVLVSCDAAALGRDAGLLARSGYELVEAVLVDLFPQTHHVEVVSTFERR